MIVPTVPRRPRRSSPTGSARLVACGCRRSRCPSTRRRLPIRLSLSTWATPTSPTVCRVEISEPTELDIEFLEDDGWTEVATTTTAITLDVTASLPFG